MIRYALAKYVPNIRRREPINVGLFLFTEYGIETMFLEPDAWKEKTGWNDEDRLNIYQDWVQYWNREAQSEDQEKCLKRLIDTSKSSYYVEEAGIIFESIREKDVNRRTLQLFAELVM